MTTMDTSRRWMPLRTPADSDGLLLFCFPHAGAGAATYRSWLNTLPRLAVVPLQPPGRENRLREAPHERMEPLVAELATVVSEAAGDRPYAMWGHSLGALVAFETQREIRRRGDAEPVHLVVSGCAAPQYGFDDGPLVGGMSPAQLVEMLRRLGGTPDWLLADPELLEMIMPAIRADFAVKETYQYRAEPLLSTPLTVLSSIGDPRATDVAQARWQDLTTGAVSKRTVVGGHFALFEQPERTGQFLLEALLG
ncbi:MAG: thioesterase II family protein [Jatrophihabitantaceae bacterium]